MSATTDTAMTAIQRRMAEATETIQRLHGRLRQVEGRADEPIAIVGSALRMPGGADTLEGFWEVLRDGVDTTAEFPAERGDARAVHHPDPDHPGTAYVIRGGFLDAVDGFDPAVFGISPREAVGMDPQQRMALELAWEALESAGYAPDSLEGSRTGAFVGVSTTDYVRLRQEIGDIRDVDHYQLFGEPSFVAGRISYTFGFQGPSAVVDTTCSSSLVALHQACTALRNRECDLALAGGVNLMLSPYGFVLMSKFRALSPDGRCKTFDASADGYARGEGGCLVTLKRLSDAEAEGDPILGVVLASAVNHDGPSSGLTVPNSEAQQAVIRAALDRAGIEPASVSYVEAHGTGTSLGDPIELRSLDAVVGTARPADDPLLVGSVKTNVGHLEPAAGIAGLIKVVLALRHEAIPPHLHLSTPNPNIPWDQLNVEVPTALRPWPRGDVRRVAGVSSFGASGTNAHALLAEAPPPARPSDPRPGARPELLLASARTPQALRALAGRYADALEDGRDDLADACYTTRVGRARQSVGLPLVGSTSEELATALRAYARGEGGPAEVALVPHKHRKAAWMFTGQGSQYHGMARGLRDEPAFAEALDECLGLFDALLPRPLADVVWDGDDTAAVNDTGYTQPALFAVSYALARALLAWGLRPSALLGHSIGEITAACLAGVMDLPDAARLVAARARLMSELPTGGGMVALSCDEATARAAIDGRFETVAVAGVNGPTDVVIAGGQAELDEAAGMLAERGVRAVPLAVSHAFHSPLVRPMLESFREVLEQITFRSPRLPLVSNVTGGLWTQAEVGPEYWLRHAAGCVRFGDGLTTLYEQGIRTFVEVGPHPVLAGLGRRAIDDEACRWVPLLRRGSDDRTALLEGLGTLDLLGSRVDWQGLDRHRHLRRVPLPTYPWERERYWFPEAVRPGAARGAGHEVAEVGVRVRAADPTFEGALGRDLQAPAEGETLAWLVERALRAATVGHGGRWAQLVDVEADAALPGAAARGWLVQWTAAATCEESVTVRCHASSPEADAAGLAWQRYGAVRLQRVAAPAGDAPPCPVPDGEPGTPVRLPDGSTAAHCEDTADAADEAACWGRLLAACSRLAGAAVAEDAARPVGGEVVALAAAACQDPRAVTHARARVTSRQESGATLDVTLHAADGTGIGAVQGLRWVASDAASSTPAWWPEDDLLFQLAWEPAGASREPDAAGERVLLVGSGGGLAGRLADELERRGARCEIVALPPGTVPDDDTVEDWLGRLDGPTSVVLLGALDLPPPSGTGPDDLRERWLPLEHAVVRVTQRLALEPEPPRLALVTRGAMPAGAGQRVHHPAAGTLWGLGRVVVLEHPDVWGGAVDLDPELDHAAAADDVGVVASALLRLDEDDQQAVRGDRRLVARLRRVPASDLPRPAPTPTRPHRPGTVLITGGFGGIGLAVARWLALRGTERIVLAARSALPDEAAWDDPALDEGQRERVEAVRRLRRLGARVEAIALDVTDADAVRGAVEALDEPGLELRGVVHAAGVSGPQLLADADPDSYRRVWEPKTVGAWTLHEATRDADLDLFVCFSSIASTWGSQHLASYSAANAFLDGLAFHRRALGLPSLTVNWGPWALASDLFDGEVMEFLESVGLHALDADQCLALLGRLLDADDPQYVVCAADWATYRPVMEARRERPMLADIAVDADEDGDASDGALAEELRACGTGDGARGRRVAVLGEHLRRAVADVLAVDAAQVEPADDVFGLGLDSLMVMELVKDCRRRLGVELRPRDFFERGTIEEWAAHLEGLAAESVDADPGADGGGDADDAGETEGPYERVERIVPHVALAEDVERRGELSGSWQDPARVLLTGATGFVGAHVLDQLLEQTRTRVTCLVRCTDPDDGFARVERTVARFLPGRVLPAERVDVVPGDLAEPGLGLDELTAERLASEVDAIYHVGAWVDFAHTFEQLAPANVGGTEALLRLAVTGPPVPVHHVSTYGIWGLPEGGRTRINEDEDILTAGRLVTGYVQSKWAAEYLARQAHDRGVPVDVYRLGRVLGDARTGVALTTHFTCRVIKGCIQLGLAPDLDFDVEMTPVDYVGRALVHISRSKQEFGDSYHLVNPHHLPFAELVRFIRERGWPVEVVSRERWWSALRDALDESSNELHPVMDTVHELVVRGEEAIDYDVTWAEKGLAGSGITCPPLDDRLLSTYFDYFVRSGYLPAPDAADR